MKKTYVVIGLGKFGTAVARRLFELGNEVLAIDDCAEKVQHIEHNVTYAVVADARDENALRSLGVRWLQYNSSTGIRPAGGSGGRGGSAHGH